MSVALREAPAAGQNIRGAPESHRHLYFLLTLMVAFWSFNYIATKIALRGFPAILLAPMRTAIAGAVILPFYFTHARRNSRWSLREAAILSVLGICGVALNQVFFVLGLGRTSVAHCAILIALTPVQVLLLAAAAGQETLTWRKLIGLAVALSGVAFLQISRDGSAAPSITGDLLILLSGFSLAIYTVFGKSVTRRHDSITMNTFAYAGGAIALSPIIFWNGRHFDFSAVTPASWLALTYMAVFSSVVSYIIYNYALARLPASRVSAFSYLQPFFATLMAIPMLGEHLTAPLLAGGALVLAGVWTTERA
jgi:drug/metabolite transporter (DMT)-like permease